MKSKQLYQLRKTTGALLGGRFKKCGCVPCSKNNEIPVISYQTKDKINSYYNGVTTCGSFWGCPVCASKISQQKQSELADVLRYSVELDYKIHFVTITLPHYKNDDINELGKVLRESWRHLTNSKGYKKAKNKTLKKTSKYFDKIEKHQGKLGGVISSKKNKEGEIYYELTYENKERIFNDYVKSIEVTYGKNGWHPHIHLLFLVDSDKHEKAIKYFQEGFYNLWSETIFNKMKRKTSKQGYKHVLGYSKEIGKYLTKWDLSKELTSNNKQGAGKTPLQLAQGTREEQKLFIKFVEAFKGVSKVRYSRTFKGLRQEIKNIESQRKEYHKTIAKTIEAKNEILKEQKKELEQIIYTTMNQDQKKEKIKALDELNKQIIDFETDNKVYLSNYKRVHSLTLSHDLFKALNVLDKQVQLLEIIENKTPKDAVIWLNNLFNEDFEADLINGVYFCRINI
jgi:hypothetical protein